MSLYESDVRKIAHLARLEIDSHTTSKYTQDLNNILKLADQMNIIDTVKIIPMAHPLDANQRLRSDEVKESDKHNNLQVISPNSTSCVYLVPQVIN